MQKSDLQDFINENMDLLFNMAKDNSAIARKQNESEVDIVDGVNITAN
jgi:hypothetical protein